HIDAPPQQFYKPVTVEQAVRFRAEHPASLIVSGGTDVVVQSNKRTTSVRVAMSIAGLRSLGAISVHHGVMHVGATTTLTDLQRAATENLPELGCFLEWFGSPPIRNAGTLAGNLVNASPIGDTIPALMVLDAEIDIAGTSGSRRVNVNRFYEGY